MVPNLFGKYRKTQNVGSPGIPCMKQVEGLGKVTEEIGNLKQKL